MTAVRDAMRHTAVTAGSTPAGRNAGPLRREFADHNKGLLQDWLSTWTARAITAVRTLQPLWSQPDNKPPRFEDGLNAVKSRFATILTDLNLDDPEGAGPVTTFQHPDSPFKEDHTASHMAGFTLMNNQVGAVVAQVCQEAEHEGHVPAVDDPRQRPGPVRGGL